MTLELTPGERRVVAALKMPGSVADFDHHEKKWYAGFAAVSVKHTDLLSLTERGMLTVDGEGNSAVYRLKREEATPKKKAVTKTAPLPPRGQRVGYVRVSTTDQNTARQLDGVGVDRVFTDVASGKDTNRDALTEMLTYVREGDTVVVHSLDRLGRSLSDLLDLVSQMTGKGITVQFVKENLVFSPDSSSPMSQLLLGIAGSFAQFERAVMLERQREGIQKARAAGRYQGRVLALSPEQVEELQRRAAAGENKSALAREYHVSRPVLYDYLKGKQQKLKVQGKPKK